MHPEYPCGHCITSAAVSTVLQAVTGESPSQVTLTSPTAPGVTRKWARLQDYSDEVSNARIYVGFHYRFSTEIGKEMGKKIGGADDRHPVARCAGLGGASTLMAVVRVAVRLSHGPTAELRAQARW
jgi:hypothetical protein